MIGMSKETALNWLWGTTYVNLGLGAVLWIFNTLALDEDDFDSGWDLANAIAWQTIGTSLWSFGVLVFVLTLATSAIVDALGGSSSSSKKLKSSSSTTVSSAKKWLSE
jgi:hypothetical protein